MKLLQFADIIAMSKEKIDAAMAPIRARQVKAKAELEMSKLDADILTAEQQVQELCLTKDVDFPKLMDKLDAIALLERRKKQYGEVLEQLFPTSK